MRKLLFFSGECGKAKVANMQGFGGLDKCSLCGVEIEGLGERMRSIDDITYIFCERCSKTRREEINKMLRLSD